MKGGSTSDKEAGAASYPRHTALNFVGGVHVDLQDEVIRFTRALLNVPPVCGVDVQSIVADAASPA